MNPHLDLPKLVKFCLLNLKLTYFKLFQRVFLDFLENFIHFFFLKLG